MVNDSACAAGVIRARLWGAGASPPASPKKSRVVAEISTGASTLTVSEKDLVTVTLLLSVTRMTNEDVPALCGVPLITPVDGLSVRPAGRVPESSAQMRGVLPPAAASVNE